MASTVLWSGGPAAPTGELHPDLPADSCIRGRLIVRQVQPDNGAAPFLLALFTDIEGPQEAILALYGQRWNIETDLRTLKAELRLDQLTCATPDMVSKEIEIALAAYNLVRAMIVTGVAAKRHRTPPLQLHQSPHYPRSLCSRPRQCARSRSGPKDPRADDEIHSASQSCHDAIVSARPTPERSGPGEKKFPSRKTGPHTLLKKFVALG